MVRETKCVGFTLLRPSTVFLAINSRTFLLIAELYQITQLPMEILTSAHIFRAEDMHLELLLPHANDYNRLKKKIVLTVNFLNCISDNWFSFAVLCGRGKIEDFPLLHFPHLTM